MMLWEFTSEFYDLTADRQKSGLIRLRDELLRDPYGYSEIIEDINDTAVFYPEYDTSTLTDIFDAAVADDDLALEILVLAENYEEDDYFGTEGLDV